MTDMTDPVTAYTLADLREAAATLDAYMADTGQSANREVLRHFALRVELRKHPATIGDLADEHWIDLDARQRLRA